MAWLSIIAAGLLEAVWASAMKAGGLRTPGSAIVMFPAMVGSFLLLAHGMRSLPLSTAYVAWTGIGAVGAVVAGAVAFGERLTITGALGAAMIVLGVALMRRAAEGAV